MLIPTYKRPADLRRCLDAIMSQERPADEVIVVARTTDLEAQAVVHSLSGQLSLKLVLVSPPGQVASLNAGIAQASGDILAITDDDAAPRADWLKKIEQHFDVSPEIAGVGGRDWVYESNGLNVGQKGPVGVMNWRGRSFGNHHLGFGAARNVDFLKGANCSFRLEALRAIGGFDARLKGSGAQVHNDMAVCLKLRRAGHTLVYDPAVAVDHFPAPRHDGFGRGVLDLNACRVYAHNEMLVYSEHLSGFGRMVYILTAVVLGSRHVFGFAQVVRFAPSLGWKACELFVASMLGRLDGWRTLREQSVER